jgi:hypothetical protein
LSGSTVFSVIIELDGMLWAPVPGTTVTAGEFAEARSVMLEVHRSLWWNPWVLTDRAAEYDAALETCGQWARAEPGHERKTPEEYEAQFAQQAAQDEARAAAEQEQAERDRAQRAADYDPDRAWARLALLEEQGTLAAKVRERDEVTSRDLFPLMEDDRRCRHLAALEQEIATAQRATDELAMLAGDPDQVCDERGWLPAERREVSLALFRARREAQVYELRASIPARKAGLKTLTGKAERARLREALKTDAARLAALEAMPPMNAADMCPECAEPDWHSPAVTFNLADGTTTGGPCPAWPRWARQVEKLHTELRARAARPKPGSPPPKPGPIAVVTLSGPLDDLTAKLAAIQASHPGAQIRPGKRNQWEIWPPEPPEAPARTREAPGG